MIAEHDALLAENAALLYQQQQLQQDVDRLLQKHQRVMQNVKAPSPANWFEGANLTLAQLAANPEPRAVQIFVAALAQLQSRLSPIVMRVPL